MFIMRNYHQYPKPGYHAKYWCETCDRDFNSYNLLENHKLQHQTCNIDGCQFIAHPNIITKHIQMQHSSGLYHKISKLKDPEEIKKWIQERKNKYPTKSNIERKKAELMEKLNRGEKIGLKQKKTNKCQNKKNNHKKLNKFQRKQNNRFEKAREVSTPSVYKNNIQNNTNNIQKEETHCGLKPFSGINMLVSEVDNEDVIEEICDNLPIEDDDYIVQEQVKISNNTLGVCNVLSSLKCNYASSDEELDNKEYNTPISDSNYKQNQKTFNVSINMQIEENDDPPEEVKFEKNVNIDNSSNNNQKTSTKNTSKTKHARNLNHVRNQHKIKYKLPSTLLEKLLFKEIKKERNHILQCIRYVVNNNFFNKS